MLTLDPAAVASLVDAAAAVDVLHDALRSGRVDPEADAARIFSPAGPGREFLLMPATLGGTSGVKLLTLSPDNPRAGRPAVQGVYVCFDEATGAPTAVLDAAELTLVRTPATTVLAARHLLRAKRAATQASAGQRDPGLRVVLFGTGPQARRHAECLHQVLAPDQIVVIGRRPEAQADVVAALLAGGVPARPPQGGPDDEVTAADLVVCVTSSPTPLFEAEAVADSAVVAALGAHGPAKHELPPALVRRADVVVEARQSALRESGNLLQARSADAWHASIAAGRPLSNLADLVLGRFEAHPDRPAVFSGVGMAWQDLIVADHVVRLALTPVPKAVR